AHAVALQKADNPLVGASAEEKAEILSWVLFGEVEVTSALYKWLLPILGYAPYDKRVYTAAVEEIRRYLKFLDTVLLNKTFLVGEQVTLADIDVALSLRSGFSKVFDAKFRSEYKNVLRWFTTVVNQPTVVAAIGETTLAVEEAKYVAPKKEAAPAKEAPKKEAKPAAAAPAEEAEEDKPAPKPKSKLDLLPPSAFNLEDWKRFYSNNDTRPKALEYFWSKFDAEGFSLWKVNYKYNDELTKVFMTSNLIGGFFNRLERARKYAFGSLVVVGEDNNNAIQGAFVIRGQEIPEEFEAPDMDSYTFEKLNPTDAAARVWVEDHFAWDGASFEGKNVPDGKVFK
ncbi:EF1G-domain-containing protein, partial [Ramicandelaber brevisporus]